jgi:hypothetical protein
MRLEATASRSCAGRIYTDSDVAGTLRVGTVPLHRTPGVRMKSLTKRVLGAVVTSGSLLALVATVAAGVKWQ